MDSQERLEWLRPGALAGSELLVVANSTRAWHVYHDRYAVCACRTAAAAWRYRGQSLYFHDRSSGLMEPGEAHCNTFIHKPMDFHVLLVSPEVFLRAAEEQGLSGEVHFRLAQTEDPRLYYAIKGLADSVEAGGTTLEQQSWLAICIHRMQAFAERTPSVPSGVRIGAAVKRATDCLRERYQEPVDLEELSALTGLSRFYLVHAFSRRVGMPPHAFQTHVRIERARALLESGVPPATVAVDVGFADQSHLNRHFKKIMQVTPGRYAKSRL